MAPGQRQKQLFYVKKDQKKSNNVKKTTKPRETSVEIPLIYPRADIAFKLLLTVRFCSAIWSYISDCDETFNYWEPSHYLLYEKGQQTWEYSPEYALRSYTYLLIHMVPAMFYRHVLEPNPVLVFYFVRCLLSVGCAFSEVYFYQNVFKEFGVHIARLTYAFLITSSGMFIASAAYLPSSFSIVPIALDMLVRKDWIKFIKWTVLSGLVILVPMVWIDSMYYGKLVIAPWNLIVYNVFTSHGPDLYGTEPISFYFINGFLNFNFVFIGALLAPLALLLIWAVVPARPRHRYCLPYWASLAPLYLWMAVMFIQPHKEERFLFPIYPMICLGGAITVDCIQKLYFFIRTKIKPLTNVSHYLQGTCHITIGAMVLCGLLGLSRSFALFKGYYAPMEIMTEANKLGIEHQIPTDMHINFCIGKEWHRFPGSFFFPSNNWQLQYLKSEFKGQLPQPFSVLPIGTSVIQPNFNDMNKEEPSRYFDIEKCHFIMDIDTGTETILEPNYSRHTDTFAIVKSSDFLISTKSHPIFRAFYVPFISPEYCKFGSYNLLRSTKLKLFPQSSKVKPATDL
ncbi:alpha-1,2-mannosyltransferase ALG9 isoform X2 [Diachasmimorpha longicaudata]|uniref:alpha-1,2-mannosyltransferase ALG9 isoform X2 n=1 Tax=Diachasmimorpha longicaudata TaxID=58733 RepID=UPI0030B8EF96